MAGNPESEVTRLVEHLFRRQAAQMLATLTHIFGFENLDLAEDVVQDALLQALKQWPYSGIPDNPRAWLIHVARNKALDLLRRRTSLKKVEAHLQQKLQEFQPGPESADVLEAEVLRDEQLAMIFACCHPDIPSDSRVALTLKAVSGFGVEEIARAFLSQPTTIAQRLVRAKRRIRESEIQLTLPDESEIPERLESVLQVLYLFFNEGYSAHAGENLVREELCDEAMRLASLLASHRSTDVPKVHALLALFCLQSARLPARVDRDGNLLLLQDQDRGLWDRALLQRGLSELEQSAYGSELSVYHVQAGIAAVHVTSSSYDDTDWEYLVDQYDLLLSMTYSPVIALNRAIALSMLEGPESGITSLERLEKDSALRNYYLLPAVKADLMRRMGREREAALYYRQALEFPCTEPERRFLIKRLAESVS